MVYAVPLGVSLGLGVLQVQRVAQRLQRDVVGGFNIFHGLTEQFGSGPHRHFKVLLVAVVLLQGLPVFQGALNGAEQALALEGLEHIVVGSAMHGVDGHADVMNRRDHHHGKLRLLPAYSFHQGNPVPVLDHDFGQHQVEVILFHHFYGFTAVGGRLYLIPLALQSGADHRPNMSFAIHHQYPCRPMQSCIRACVCLQGHRGADQHFQSCQIQCQVLILP